MHADEVGGWPPIVEPVLKASREGQLVNSLDELPVNIVARTSAALGTIVASWEARSRLQRQNWPAPSSSSQKLASGVAWAIKAPCSFLLLPFWAELFGRRYSGFRFLHVVRDGRDIAFSDNWSPVRKFYNATFGEAHWKETPGRSIPLRAIELWSAWNSQVMHWSRATAALHASFPSSSSFQYMVLHTEDLVEGAPEARLRALQALRSFVGSSLSDEDLCCIVAQQDAASASSGRSQLHPLKHSPGQQRRLRGAHKPALTARYGKWHSRVENDPALNTSLHAMGAEGLELFGQAPPRDWHEEYPAATTACSKVTSFGSLLHLDQPSSPSLPDRCARFKSS